jgi:hypothetical protein
VCIDVKPGADPCVLLQVGGVTPCRDAPAGGFEPGYRVDAPRAEREIAGAGACPAGAPQRCAATWTRNFPACVAPGRGTPRPDTGDASRGRRAAWHFVEHLVCMRIMNGEVNW